MEAVQGQGSKIDKNGEDQGLQGPEEFKREMTYKINGIGKRSWQLVATGSSGEDPISVAFPELHTYHVLYEKLKDGQLRIVTIYGFGGNGNGSGRNLRITPAQEESIKGIIEREAITFRPVAQEVAAVMSGESKNKPENGESKNKPENNERESAKVEEFLRDLMRTAEEKKCTPIGLLVDDNLWIRIVIGHPYWGGKANALRLPVMKLFVSKLPSSEKPKKEILMKKITKLESQLKIK